jgi:hypothetical protein
MDVLNLNSIIDIYIIPIYLYKDSVRRRVISILTLYQQLKKRVMSFLRCINNLQFKNTHNSL